MNTQNPDLWEKLLQLIAESAPNPWYPSQYVRATGIDRDSLDLPLEKLRLNGLVQLTDWVQGLGQGYILTLEGRQFLHQPATVVPTQEETTRAPCAAVPEQVVLVFADPKSRRQALAIRDDLTRPFTPLVTWLLLLTNFLFFGHALWLAGGQDAVESVLQGTNMSVLRQTGALKGSDIFERGEWWRLLTCCFVHIGLIHLGVNMLSLFLVGPLLERMWGHAGFLTLYLIAGVGGSCAMVIEAPLAYGAGASGALWGGLASMATWLYLNRRFLPRALLGEWRRQLVFIFVLNVALTFGVKAISKGAHLGGGAIGLITAVPLYYLRWGQGWYRVLAGLGIMALPALCLAMLNGKETLSRLLLPNPEQGRSGQAGNNGSNRPQVEVHGHRDQEPDASPDVYKRACNLLRIDPDERKPAEDVEKVLLELASERKRLAKLSESLNQQGSDDRREVNEARREYLQAQAALLKEAEICLRQARPYPRSINDQANLVEELRKKWLKLRQQAR